MDSKPSIMQLAGSHAVAIRARVPRAEIASFFAPAFAELEALAGRHVSGPPFALYYSLDPESLDVAAAMPTWSRVETTGRIEAIELPAGPAVKVEHVGKYDELPDTYAILEDWLVENERAPGGPRREVFLTMPMAPPSEQITIVIQPIEPVTARAKKPDGHIERTTRHELRGAPISK